MTQDRMRFVGSPQIREFFLGQLEVGAFYCILDMMGFCRTDDRGGHPGLMKDPSPDLSKSGFSGDREAQV